MRVVNKATCTSGEPVSFGDRPYSRMMVSFSLLLSDTFSSFNSPLQMLEVFYHDSLWMQAKVPPSSVRISNWLQDAVSPVQPGGLWLRPNHGRISICVPGHLRARSRIGGALGFRVAHFVGAGAPCPPEYILTGDHGRLLAQGIVPTSISPREILSNSK